MPGEQEDFDSWMDEGSRGTKLRSRWRRLGIAAAVIVIGGFGAISWYAYDLGRRSGGSSVAPLIVADGRPTKVRPDDPGGKVIPDQDKLVYERPRGGPSPGEAERLLPPPETPLPRPPAPIMAAPAPAPVLQAPVPQAPILQAPVPQVTPPAEARRAAAPPATTPLVLAPPVAPPAPGLATPAAPTLALPVPAPTLAQQRQTAEARPAAGGAFKVQIAATRSDADAHATWTRLQAANRDLLGSLALSVQRADLGERGTFYRVQAGGLADTSAAQSLCTALKARKVDCMVVRP